MKIKGGQVWADGGWSNTSHRKPFRSLFVAAAVCGQALLTLIVPRAWDIGFTHPFINCQGKSATHFVYFWSLKTLPYTHLEAILYIPQQRQSLHIWNTSLSTTGCYKNKYTIQFLKLACISRFAAAISSSKTELTLGTIRVKQLNIFQLINILID